MVFRFGKLVLVLRGNIAKTRYDLCARAPVLVKVAEQCRKLVKIYKEKEAQASVFTCCREAKPCYI